MKRFLITTAIEETWTDDMPVLFLGEWCRLFDRKEHWSSMDAEVLPYHWEDSIKFDVDYHYLIVIYERFLEALANQLNQIHGVNHELRYWRILIGPWLALFTQILFDRWSCIQQAVRSFDISGTIILTGREETWVPNDMLHFGQLMTGDEWNHHIYAVILQQFTKVPCITKAHEKCTAHSNTKTIGLKQKLLAAYTSLASRFVRDRDVFLLATFLPTVDELRLYLRFGQIPQFWQSVSAIPVSIDWRQRNFVMAIQGQSDFETFALALIPKHIPAVYLEGYRQLIEQVRELPWPKHPKLIFSSNALFYDTVAMAYTAEKTAAGTPLAYAQHGGNYWMLKLHWGESHEVEIPDTFLSWGRVDDPRPNIRPVGFLLGRFARNATGRKKLVLVTHCPPRYSYSLYSGPKSTQVLERSLSNMFSFVAAALPVCRDDLLVRLTHSDFGWNFFSRWRERFPRLALDRGGKKMQELMADARLVVCTYCSTAFFEALASDVPAMIFWDPEVDPISESAMPSFEDFKRVGIFHATPASAARHVANIWNDVDAWWFDPAVQEVLAGFKRRYCQTSGNRLDRVEAVLREVMAEKSAQRKLAAAVAG